MITLKEYAKVKNNIENELQSTRQQIKDMFDGEGMFVGDLYSDFSKQEKRVFSQLKHIETLLLGQLDTFKILEGFEEQTELEKSKRWFDRLMVKED